MEIVASFLNRAPIDLHAMASRLGLTVTAPRTLSPTVSGSIRRQGESYLIEINGNDPPRRQRFTLAHEISHFLIHRDMLDGGITDDRLYRSGLSNNLERQASRLAGQILMPPGLVMTAWRAGARDIGRLAEVFDVSEQAMEIRLRELGLHGPCAPSSPP
jgi:Zn-dependent peptidase ImmA (M78 family)